MIARKTTISLIVSFFIILIGAGCVAPFSKEVLGRVNKGVIFSDLFANPDNFRGQVVMVGGRVLETVPKDGHTEMMILQQPLSFDYSPYGGDETGGRFLLTVQGFLDPAVYSSGRKITTVAEVQGAESRPLGEKSYVYPALNAIELKLWPPPPKEYPFMYDPLRGPQWGPYWGPFGWPPPPQPIWRGR